MADSQVRRYIDVPPIDAESIDEARRAAIRNRLIGEGATEVAADAWRRSARCGGNGKVSLGV